MFDPKKRLGADDDEGKKPALVIGMRFKPEKRLGEEEPDGDEAEPSGDLEGQAEQAAEKICRLININSAKASELRALIETICIAADAKPHREGEHTDEEEN